MYPSEFEYHRAASVKEALGLIQQYGDDAKLISGGHSLLPILKLRLAQPRHLVDIARIAELGQIAEQGGRILVGAGVPHRAVHTSDLVRNKLGLLAECAGNIGDVQVRNRGTIGGSLCHADPAADWVTVLTALGAVVLLQGPDGMRSLYVADFILGAFRTALHPGEILREIRIPRLPGDARWGYEKACRKPGDFAHAMAAVLLHGDARRAVIGALGSKPLLLEGDDASVEGATRALQALEPVQRHMQLSVLRRAFAKAEA